VDSLRQKMASAHLPFGQHAIRQGVAVRDSRRYRASALEGGCRQLGDGTQEGRRGDDMQEHYGDASGGHRGDDGVDGDGGSTING
jgi:hypothetical protein